jgi:hypothetical protein
VRRAVILSTLCALAVSVALADEPAKPDAKKPADAKQMSGISILGNQDSPKSLVIVPWKSSEIGAGIGLSNSLNNRAAPVDKDVFARQLHYYELRSGATRN